MVTDVQDQKTDRKKNTVGETLVWSLTFTVESVLEKKKGKKPVCEIMVWSLMDQSKIWKKLQGLSDSGYRWR